MREAKWPLPSSGAGMKEDRHERMRFVKGTHRFVHKLLACLRRTTIGSLRTGRSIARNNKELKNVNNTPELEKENPDVMIMCM